MATATVNVVAYLGSDFTTSVITAIKNGTRAETAVRLVDSNRADGRPTVQLVTATSNDIFGFVERDISGDALNPSSVDSNGNVTYNTIGTIKRSGIVQVVKRDNSGGANQGDAIAGVATDIGMGIEGWSGGTSTSAPIGSVAVAATGGYGKIIARNGNNLFVLLD